MSNYLKRKAVLARLLPPDMEQLKVIAAKERRALGAQAAVFIVEGIKKHNQKTNPRKTNGNL